VIAGAAASAAEPRAEVAIVTGAASGMGRATAQRLVTEGWAVVGVDVNDAALRAVGAEMGERFLPCAVDVVDRGALDTALHAAIPETAFVTAVVNAAGIYPPTTLADVTVESYRHIFDINVLGTLNVTAAAMEYIRAHGKGAAVVNFASVDALTVSPGQLLYSASKAAVVAITRSLAIELAPDGVVVNGVAPGWVDTPGNRATGRMEAALASVPLKRAAAPEEIADWVCRLCRRGAYLTGETIAIAGGIYMH
jgi:3-oxoacyl-[acyl-carrier protein] reductase